MMNLFKKLGMSETHVVLLLATLVVLYVTLGPKSSYQAGGHDDDMANADLSNAGIDLNASCAMANGTGLASSLLPREVATQDDFGQFSPDEILKSQNFLDPRQQIGFPETLGGVIRNGNQQVRAEPANPKQPYTWNNSTIPSDAAMQRPLC
jgi:hypothetical protein